MPGEHRYQSVFAVHHLIGSHLFCGKRLFGRLFGRLLGCLVGCLLYRQKVICEEDASVASVNASLWSASIDDCARL